MLQPGAGHVEGEIRILPFQLPELVVENDPQRIPHAVQHRDLRVQLAQRRFARKRPERRNARSARHTNQMLVRLQHGQKLAHRRNDEQFVTRLGPVHHARAHLAVTLDRHLIITAFQRTGGKRICPFIGRRVRPVNRDELPRLEIRIMTVGPFQAQGFYIGKFGRDRLNCHFKNFFGHKSVAKRLINCPPAGKGRCISCCCVPAHALMTVI